MYRSFWTSKLPFAGAVCKCCDQPHCRGSLGRSQQIQCVFFDLMRFITPVYIYIYSCKYTSYITYSLYCVKQYTCMIHVCMYYIHMYIRVNVVYFLVLFDSISMVTQCFNYWRAVDLLQMCQDHNLFPVQGLAWKLQQEPVWCLETSMFASCSVSKRATCRENRYWCSEILLNFGTCGQTVSHFLGFLR